MASLFVTYFSDSVRVDMAKDTRLCDKMPWIVSANTPAFDGPKQIPKVRLLVCRKHQPQFVVEVPLPLQKLVVRLGTRGPRLKSCSIRGSGISVVASWEKRSPSCSTRAVVCIEDIQVADLDASSAGHDLVKVGVLLN